MSCAAATSVFIIGDIGNYWKKAWLRKPEKYDLATTGSAERFAIEGEFTLECRNEKTGGWVKQNKSS